jgi:AcrR family transcriptional regulator
MTALAEQDPGTAARILAAARELVLKRGVKGLTIAEIAERAHVGKGTAYLYWKTKDELLLGLFARDFLAFVDDEIDALTTDPDIARPHRLFPRLVRNFIDRPFTRAMQSGDADLLGALARHPRSMELLDQSGPAGLVDTVLPVWRAYLLARTDWPLDEQAYALHALLAGFLDTATRRQVLRGVTVDAPEKVMAAAVTALLGPEEAGPAELHATAEEGLRLLRARRNALLALITRKTKHANEPEHIRSDQKTMEAM